MEHIHGLEDRYLSKKKQLQAIYFEITARKDEIDLCIITLPIWFAYASNKSYHIGVSEF